MSGETKLAILLENMDPVLNPGEYVFCTRLEADAEAASQAVGSFREKEGMTYILPKPVADQFNFTYGVSMAWISLQVHSSLQAVGLTAAVAGILAEAGISCNVVAAFYHDHLFVPAADAGQTLDLLRKMSSSQGLEK